MIPYQQSVCNKITRLLVKCNIKAIHICVKKNIHMLRAIKYKKGLKVTGIYCVLHECNKVYIGQIGRTIKTRCKVNMKTHIPGPARKV